MRKYLLVILAFSVVGTVTELFLLEHTEGFWQWVPIALLLLSILGIAWNSLRDNRISRRFLQLIMLLFIIGGFVGIGLHYKGNVEFELEMYPSMEGMELFWKTIKGATPVLAPGAMMTLGLVGLLSTLKD